MTVKKKVDKMLSHFVTPPFSVGLLAKSQINKYNRNR